MSELHLHQSGIRQERLEPTPEAIAFFSLLEDTAKEIARSDRAEVERSILAGENDITVHLGHDRIVRYTLPSLWRHPIRRARIGLARRAAR